MEPNFLDEGCDVFINENGIKLEERLKVRIGLKKFQTLNQKWWSYAINYEKIAWAKQTQLRQFLC